MTGGARPSAVAAGGQALGRAGPLAEQQWVGGRFCGALGRESRGRLRTSALGLRRKQEGKEKGFS
jgi:hypothetical protein